MRCPKIHSNLIFLFEYLCTQHGVLLYELYIACAYHLLINHGMMMMLCCSMLLEAGVWMQSNAENQLAVKGERYRLTKSSSIIRFRSTGYCYGYVVVEPAISHQRSQRQMQK